jgi:hypothetical protein
MYERGVPGGTLNLNSTGYPDHGRYVDLPLQVKIARAEPGIEPETSWLVVRSHGAGKNFKIMGQIFVIPPISNFMKIRLTFLDYRLGKNRQVDRRMLVGVLQGCERT